MNIEDTIHETGLPVNAYPMIDRLRQLLEESHTNALGTITGPNRIRMRKVLWLLTQQVYGQVGVVDMADEWAYLDKYTPGQEAHWEAIWEHEGELRQAVEITRGL
jgi:hypothetical protein